MNSSLHNKHDFVGGVELDVVIRGDHAKFQSVLPGLHSGERTAKKERSGSSSRIRSIIIADIFLDSFSTLESSSPTNIDYAEGSLFPRFKLSCQHFGP